MPFSNWIVSVAFGLIASVRARRRLRDVHSAQRAYKREVIDRFDWDVKGMALPVDLLMWPAKAGAQTSEIPISYSPRTGGESKLIPLSGGVQTMRRLFRPAREMRPRS